MIHNFGNTIAEIGGSDYNVPLEGKVLGD